MTELIISVAKFPGKGGEQFHNRYFKMFGLDYRYVALAATNIEDVLESVRKLGIRGCSIAHPFKMQAINHVDELDKTARQTGAINTVLNQDGYLIGYNTDIAGAEATLKMMEFKPDWDVAILGNGGATRAVVQALKNLKAMNYRIYARNYGNWEERVEHTGDLLINTTTVGMENKHESPFPLRRLSHFKACFDVIPHVTALQAQACGRGLKNKCGYLMKTVQAERQFEIYTGLTL